MQRSPVRKSPRLQATKDNIATTSGAAALASQKMVQPATNINHPIEQTSQSTLMENVFDSINEIPQNLPTLLPAPGGLQSSCNNLNENVECLQRQIERLQAQLLEAQETLKATENVSTVYVDQNMAASVEGNNFENQNTVERCNRSQFSNLTPTYQDQQMSTAQTGNPSTSQRKLYDLPEFQGAPEDWPMFLSAFEHSNAAYNYNNFENCLRLQKALRGEARECVKSLLIHPNNVPTVIEQLRVQYGRPDVLIRCQIQKIKEIQQIGENAADKLIPYSIKVRNLAAFLEAANGQQHLSNPTLMDELVQKLPMSKRLDWAQFASTLKQWPTVLDFSVWLQRVANFVRSVQTTNVQTINRPNSDSKRKVVLHTANAQHNKECPICQETHKLFNCKKFLSLPVPQRWIEVKKLKLCFSCLGAGHLGRLCRARKSCSVDGCLKKHNKLLHEFESKINSNNPISNNLLPEVNFVSENESVLSCVTRNSDKARLLFRVVPIVLYGPNNKVETYALLDEGSSVTMVDSSLVQYLGLQGQHSKLNLQWYAGKASQEMATVVNMHVSKVGSQRKYVLRNVYGVSNLKLPAQSFNMNLSAHPGLPIKLYDNITPKVLIGLDHCHLGLPDEIVPLSESGPYAANTPLGWVVFGQMKGNSLNNSNLCLFSAQSDQRLNDLVTNYFDAENFGVKLLPIIESKDDIRARKIMKETTIKTENRFQTKLLWRNDDIALPDSYPMALNRLNGICRKMKRNPEFAAAYKDIMKNYVSKGYAKKLSPNEVAKICPRTWYLPHFGVVNPNKPGKIRLVFDAAASVEGISLNSNLLKGPQEYKPLPTILFNFRVGAVAVCGDIKEMFHQVLVAPEDRCSQRFLWREDNKIAPDSYEMLVMTFGAACSPYVAHYVKNTNALSFSDQCPRAVKSIIDHHYVDDFVDSFPTSAKAIEIALQVRDIHKAAGFELRNFSSNSVDVIMALRGTANNNVNFCNDVNELGAAKVLGMYWRPKDDTFKFDLKFHKVNNEVLEGKRCPTKRELLSVVMSVFDPLGFLCNYMITAKLVMREVWRHDIRWDDVIPDVIGKKWNSWREELKNVVVVKIPRCYFAIGSPSTIELHIFVDASEDAFGAVAYWRYTTYDGSIAVSFISAKSKCAPLKFMSIPRLELQAAILGTRLMCTILKEHDIGIIRRICWSDSTTVINWIASESRRYKPFVAHRIAEILEATRPDDWRWLPTDMNVADETTRMKNKMDFSNKTRWFQGPHFLYKDEEEWPKNNITKTMCEEELRPKFMLMVSTISFIDFNRFSSFLRLIRSMAWVLKFISRCKKMLNCNNKSYLTSEEIKVAETILCRLSQEESFTHEIQDLNSGCKIRKDNDFYKLSPYFDENKLLRVSGRIDAASWLPIDVKRPIILSPSHKFTQLFVAHIHKKLKHQNFEATMSEIRRKFWIPRLRNLLKKTIKNCYFCKLRSAAPVTPFMGSLPSDRLTPYIRPFTFTGIDYFGPLNITVGRRHEKRWVALFTCLTIRAVHLEVVFDLSTDACILAIRNFINRRGTPLKMRSDNGKNFVGVNNEASRFEEVFDMVKIQDDMSTRGIEWKFNCPHSPAEGGAWERMVQCVKKVLRVTLKEVAPKEHTLQSFLIEEENILNSRPLTHLPVSHEDEEPLTPNHFLLGSANTSQTPKATDVLKSEITRKQWRISRQLRDHFWKRWIDEYLPTLTRRSKWCEYTKPIKIGDLVLICDPAVSRRDWKRGKVIQVFPGNDGVIRKADVQTNNGTLKRPVSKLAVLDLDSES